MNEKARKNEERKPLQIDEKLIGLANAVSGIIREEEQKEYDNRRAQGQNNPFGY
jgi:hypothetical protein